MTTVPHLPPTLPPPLPDYEQDTEPIEPVTLVDLIRYYPRPLALATKIIKPSREYSLLIRQGYRELAAKS